MFSEGQLKALIQQNTCRNGYWAESKLNCVQNFVFVTM